MYGKAGSTVPGDDLDVTTTSSKLASVSQVSSNPAAKEDATKSKIPGSAASSTTDDGLSVTQKLMFIGGVLAVCALFVRTRDGKSSNIGTFKEKSMA